MKKIVFVLMICGLLWGCSPAGFETLGSVPQTGPEAPRQQVSLSLPPNAAENAWQGEEETMYIVDDYIITLQTLASGDVKNTVKQLSGFDKEQLTVLETQAGGIKRYEWVWFAAGEGGDSLCRCAVLDDGNYHYTLTVSANASIAGELTNEWNDLFSSFRLEV